MSIAIAGSGGSGVMTAGTMLLDAAARAGLYGLMVRTSGPQIRGGEAAALLRLAQRPIDSLDDGFDLLLAMDWQNVNRFADEITLHSGSLVIGDADEGDTPEVFARSGARCLALPLKKRAKAIAGSWSNMLVLGLVGGLVGLPASALEAALRATWKRTDAGLQANLAALQAGFAEAATIGETASIARLEGTLAGSAKRWLISGNEAAGYGAVRGGVRFVAAYPITPATELLEWMAPALAKVGGTLLQAEDELASANMIIGASFGGVPSLTATAGPGLALMTEAIGLAVAAEVPIVVVDVMRGGPSTGIPAKSEQSDLSFAVSGLHGDAPRLVLAPNSIADCAATTQWAVQLAEALQAPAIVLSDQFMGQSRAIIDRPADSAGTTARLTAAAGTPDYKRYRDTPSGVSPMSIPGTPGLVYTADGLEHSEAGIPSSQSRDHRLQLDKRERKLALARIRPALGRHRGRRRRRGDHLRLRHRHGARGGGPRRRAGRARAPDLAAPARAGPARADGAGAGRRDAGAGGRTEPRRAALPLPALDVRPAAPARELPPPRAAAAAAGRADAGHRRLAARRGACPGGRMNDLATPQAVALTAASYKSAAKPIWCPGCGDFTVLSAITKALAMMQLPPHEVAVVSGIGCSSRIPAYTNCYGFHGVHGRALAAGTGLKVARPDLTVLVTGGDGDGYSIGGNHFMHACRRNVDLTYIVMDNHVYGMTKGQASPTTEPDWDNKLSPGGTGIRSFHPLVIALASGASFVARAFSGDPNGTADIIAQGIRHPGFAFIEVLSPCVTFRPEQREWKQHAHPAPVAPTDDPARAARRIMTDDGFNIGVLYAGSRTPYPAQRREATHSVAELEAEFQL